MDDGQAETGPDIEQTSRQPWIDRAKQKLGERRACAK
jgi:hypothetical protein